MHTVGAAAFDAFSCIEAGRTNYGAASWRTFIAGLPNPLACTFTSSAGPEAELEYWRTRAVWLDAIAEQLAGAEHRAVAAVCTAAAVPACERWRGLELRLADAAAEAKETVKYLSTLEGSLECIYSSGCRQGAAKKEGWCPDQQLAGACFWSGLDTVC